MASLQSLENWLFMSYYLAAKAVPMVAVGSSLVFAVSPLHTVRTIQRAQSTLQYSFAPFFFFFVQSVIYTLYAIVTTNALMGASSFVSSVLGLHYVVVYCRHAANRTRPIRYVTIALTLLTLLALHAFNQSHDAAQLLIGIPGNILSLLTSASPLLQIQTILRTRDASCLPFGMCVMTVVAGGLWLLYGLLLQDPLIIYPNIFALTMGLIQVALIVHFNTGSRIAVKPPPSPTKPTAEETAPTKNASTIESIVEIFTQRKQFHEKV